MIEILNTYDQVSEKDDIRKLSNLPKNLRQIGEVNSKKKIYIEDYVYTYLNQYASSDVENSQIAVLLGHYYKHEGEKIILISGAVQAKYFLHNSTIEFTNETWTYIYDKIKEFFDDYAIVGWMYSHPGFSTGINEKIKKLHNDNFPGNDKVLYIIDPVEKEDGFYLNEQRKLSLQEGYYIYYERNKKMHNYMLSYRINEEKLEPEPEEEVVVNYRRQVRNRKQEVYHRKLINMLYVTSGALVIIVLVIGIALMNNYDKMKNMETTLNKLTNNINHSNDSNDKNEDNETDDGVIDDEETNKTGETINNIVENTGDENIEEQNDSQQENQRDEQENNSQPVDNTQNYKTYTIQEGDTLAIICYKFYNSSAKMSELLELNNIEEPNKIYVGQKIILPQP